MIDESCGNFTGAGGVDDRTVVGVGLTIIGDHSFHPFASAVFSFDHPQRGDKRLKAAIGRCPADATAPFLSGQPPNVIGQSSFGYEIGIVDQDAGAAADTDPGAVLTAQIWRVRGRERLGAMAPAARLWPVRPTHLHLVRRKYPRVSSGLPP